MNNKGEFALAIFIGILVFVIFVATVFALIDNSNKNAIDKHERICEKKGMEYFDYHRTGWTDDRTVVCLNDEGTQIEAKLK